MKKKITKIGSILLSAMLTLGCTLAAGCDMGGEASAEPQHPLLPDYSGGKEFEFFSYRTLTDGHYTIDGVDYFSGEDFRSVERWREYKECGFTMAYPEDKYSGEPWETSDLKKTMEDAAAAGFDKIIVADNRLNGLCDWGFEGFNEKYYTDEILDAYVEGCIKDIIQMPSFYGFTLKDEPNFKKQGAYGRTYKSVLRVVKKYYDEGKCGVEVPYIHMNFLPTGGYEAMVAPAEITDFTEQYTAYLEGFITNSGTKRISVDTYAFMRKQITPGFYHSLQIMSDLATKHDIDTSYCLQSFHTIKVGQNDFFSKVGKSEMYLEINSVIGHGMDNFAYYTYCPDRSYSAGGGKTIDGGNFLTRDGERTNVWYYAQSIMEEMKPLGKIINSYDFLGSDFVINKNGPINFTTTPYLTSNGNATGSQMSFRRGYLDNCTLLKSVELDNDIALVSEFHDSTNDLYMYMLQNVINPIETGNGQTDMTLTATFDSSYTWVAEYDCGVINYVPLENGTYTRTLPAGYAVYVIPLK